MGARQWYKVHSAWWTSPSHAHLGATTLGFGLFLVWIADRDPEWRERGSARLMNGDGSPMSVAQIARLARERRDTCSRVTLELQGSGTLVVDESQFLTFPNFAKWQQSRSTRALAQANRVSESDGEEKRTDEKREEKKKSPKKGGVVDRHRESASRVLAHLSLRRSEVVPGARELKPTQSNLQEIAGRLEDGEDEALLIAIVDAAAAGARGKPEQHQWLNPTTPFRRSNLARYAAMADGSGSTTSVSTLEEAKAYADAHDGTLPAGWKYLPTGEVVRR